MKDWKTICAHPHIEVKEGNSTIDGDEELAFAESIAAWRELPNDAGIYWTSDSADGKYRYIGVEWEKTDVEETDKAVIFKVPNSLIAL